VLQAATANAQSCVFTNTGVDFGNVNLTVAGTKTATGTITANCTGIPNRNIRVCANFNQGSGGAHASSNPRYMLQGVTRLNYNLYRSNGGNRVWGSYTWAPSPNPPRIVVNLNNSGTGSESRTIYGRIPSGQGALPTGTYQSFFSGAHTQIDYGYTTSFNCSSTLSPRVQNVPFTVRVTNRSSCTVSTAALDFGNQTNLSTAKTAVNSVSVTCTGGTLYNIGLNNGSSGGTGPTTRLMRNASTAQAITYGIYRNNSHTLPWGNTIGSDTVSATGTGLAQSFTGFGRIPVQTTPPALLYTDTVVVTVTY